MTRRKFSSEEERAVALYARKRKLLGEEKWAVLCDEVEKRLTTHLLQQPESVTLGRNVLGGQQFFGVAKAPRILDEPPWMESKYVLCEVVDHAGVAKGLVVTLRCWADFDCKTAIEYNKSMVARVLSDKKMNFSTRMQTDVQTRTVIMWLRLRGRLFWNKNLKINEQNLYFDSAACVLRKIHSDDFCGWLHAHSQINPKKADFEFLMAQIDAAAMNSEIAHECEPGALIDRRGDTIYISNGDAEMIRVKPAVDGVEIVECVPNGTDNVVFTQGMTLAPWKVLDGPGEDPFETCPPFSTANYSSEHGRMIARLWFLGLASCYRSYPAIVFTGKMRSGKSRTAKAVFELLGAPVRLSAIREAGEKDFWTVINKGGVVCFDNVDSRNKWFGDAMQLACTDGSAESRTLYSNDETTTLRANAKIILTSNNPMFASESGLADRLQIVRLNQFDAKNGKESGDSALSQAIAEHRDAALTWFAKTVSRALADREKVEPNVNMRHPDFAAFAMRCARALSADCYSASVRALKSAEFDKALLTIQNDYVLNFVYEMLVARFTDPATADLKFEGTAGEIMAEIVKLHPDLEHSKYINASKIGLRLKNQLDLMSTLFEMNPPEKYASQTRYTIKGFSDQYAKNAGITIEKPQNTEGEEDDDLDDLL